MSKMGAYIIENHPEQGEEQALPEPTVRYSTVRYSDSTYPNNRLGTRIQRLDAMPLQWLNGFYFGLAQSYLMDDMATYDFLIDMSTVAQFSESNLCPCLIDKDL